MDRGKGDGDRRVPRSASSTPPSLVLSSMRPSCSRRRVLVHVYDSFGRTEKWEGRKARHGSVGQTGSQKSAVKHTGRGCVQHGWIRSRRRKQKQQVNAMKEKKKKQVKREERKGCAFVYSFGSSSVIPTPESTWTCSKQVSVCSNRSRSHRRGRLALPPQIYLQTLSN